MFVRLRSTLISSLLLAAIFALGACSQPQPAPDEAAEESEPVSVKLIGFNDFHGNLDGPAGNVSVDGEEVPAGGVAQMKAHIDRISADEPNSIVVAAGDMVGASPLVSAVFHDEPAIEAMDAIGLELTAVGNHEFDRGWQELIRLQDGGCHPEEGCREGYEFAGAEFQYLAANVQNPDGEPLLPGHEVRTFGDVPVGFIGLVVDDAPKIISPTSIEGLSFRHEPEVINEVAAGLQQEGVEAIVVLIHEGGRPTTEQASIDDCGDIEGPIVDIVKESSDAVDVFVTGHSHQTYICEIDGKLVTSAESYGRLLTEIDLVIDPETGDVVEKQARNHVVSQDIEADAKLAKLVSTYVDLSAEVAQRPVGTISETISRETNDAGESALGDVIANAQLAATSAPDKGDAQVA
ncbi:MAG: metallophosphoesterase, partial [Persicimonas sp.]